jgi:two-component system, OmpR family, phosphate regulon sensor histidine kinase PhoR
MERWKIWSIIIIMSIALVGVALSQIYWIKWSISLDEKNFDAKVFRALNEVKKQIDDNIKNQTLVQDITKDLLIKETENYINKLKSDSSQWRKSQILSDTRSLTFSLNPEIYLENLDPKLINEFIKSSLKNQGIKLDYNYGIFSKKYEDFIIINDHFVSPSKNEKVSKTNISNSNIYNSKYQIQLLTTEFKSPGSLKLHFKNKSEWIWSNILPTMLMNMIFTLLILFAFSYTIYIILKQKKISQMKTDFVNNMTHEFKTPIATISIAADAILNPAIISDKNKILKFANIIQEENSRLLNQVEQILNIAKLDKHRIQLNMAMVNVHDIIERSCEHLALKLEKKKGELKTDFKADDPEINADEIHLINIFNNLIDNAIKYSLTEPKIAIKTQNAEKGIEIIISDNGIGIPKQDIKFIFDKFYRVSTGNVHNIKGFGLGLAYVRTFVEAHKGKIFVKSSKNKGTEFKIYFPKL